MKKKMISIAGIFFFIAGIAVLFYYPLQGFAAKKKAQSEISAFQTETKEAENNQEPYDRLLADMKAYNEKLSSEGQSGLKDAWSYEQPVFNLQEYGLTDDVAAVLKIPAMDQELPVYLGATKENMAKGVAVLGQTSMPIGGMDTNCVIAGHRGNGAEDVFKEIQLLKIGDEVILETFWSELRYQVESTAVIEPDEVDRILIQKGKDMVTLITCHPYPQNTDRYVVYCTAEGTGDLSAASAEPSDNETAAMAQDEEKSSRMILLEKNLPYLAIPLTAVLLGLLFVPKKKKGGRK